MRSEIVSLATLRDSLHLALRLTANDLTWEEPMSSSGHDHPGLGPPSLIEVADRVFAYIQPDGSR
jgi:hypothetical protein